MKILFTDLLHDEGIRLLKNANFEVIDGTNASIEKKISLSRDVDAWLIRSGTTINKKAIDRAQKLKIIGRAGVGVDNIDIECATKRGIVVTATCFWRHRCNGVHVGGNSRRGRPWHSEHHAARRRTAVQTGCET